jgi:hypothetical protein
MGHQFLILNQALLFCLADTQFVAAGKSKEFWKMVDTSNSRGRWIFSIAALPSLSRTAYREPRPLLSFTSFQSSSGEYKLKEDVMHAVVRNYSGKGSKKLIDVIEKNKAEVEGLLRAINGFVSYYLVRTTRGGFSVSVYQDKAGTDESIRVARDWIAKNAGKLGTARPTVSEGTVVFQLK